MKLRAQQFSTKQFSTKQQGMVLVVALLFLLIMTILGISSVSSSFMEEKMVGNSLNREKAFQAAEAALRAGELFLAVGTNKDTAISNICGTALDSTDDCDRSYNANGSKYKSATSDLGDTCPGGYCTPREQDFDYDKDATHDCGDSDYIPERWETCTASSAAAGNNINGSTSIFDTAGKYIVYPGTDLNSMVNQEPRYIIEFLGFRIPEGELSACDLDSDGFNETPADSAFWPFCPNDLAYFRITALGYGGTNNTRVMLQSTVIVN